MSPHVRAIIQSTQKSFKECTHTHTETHTQRHTHTDTHTQTHKGITFCQPWSRLASKPGPDVTKIINSWRKQEKGRVCMCVHVCVCVCACAWEGQNKLMADFSPCFDGIKSLFSSMCRVKCFSLFPSVSPFFFFFDKQGHPAESNWCKTPE